MDQIAVVEQDEVSVGHDVAADGTRQPLVQSIQHRHDVKPCATSTPSQLDGILVACLSSMSIPSYRPAGNAKDDCWVCSSPVYEGDASVRYLGLWIHESCFSHANLSGDQDHGGHGEDIEAA